MSLPAGSGTYRFYSYHAPRKSARRRNGQDGQAADPGENDEPAPLRFVIESHDVIDKAGAIGEIDVVDVQREAGLYDDIGIIAIGLERAGCIDDQVGRCIAQLADEITIAIERQRDELCCRGNARAKGLRLRTRAAGDQQRQLRTIGEQSNQTAAEGSIAAEDENLHAKAVQPITVWLLPMKRAYFARACAPASASTLRNVPPPITRCGNGIRAVRSPSARSSPSGSTPVTRHAPSASPSSLVA